MSKNDADIYKDRSWNNNFLKNAFNFSNMVTIKNALTNIVPEFINEELKRSNTLYSNRLKVYNESFKSKLYEFKKEICDVINNCEEMKEIINEKLTPEKKEIFSPFFTEKYMDVSAPSEYVNYVYFEKPHEIYYDELDGDFQYVIKGYGRDGEMLLTSRFAVYESIFKDGIFHNERYSDILFGLDKNNKFTIKRRVGNDDHPVENRDTSKKVCLNPAIPDDLSFSDKAFNGLLRDVSNNKKLDKLYRELLDFSKIYNSIVDEYERDRKSILEKYCNIMIKLDNGKYIKFIYDVCEDEDIYSQKEGRYWGKLYRNLRKKEPYVDVFYTHKDYDDLSVDVDNIGIENGIGLNYYGIINNSIVGLSVYDEDLKKIDSFTKYLYDSNLNWNELNDKKRLLNYFIDTNSLEVFNPFNPSREKQVIESEKEIQLLEKEIAEQERLKKQKELYHEKVKKSEEVVEKRKEEKEKAKKDLVNSLEKLKEFNEIEKVQVPYDQIFDYDSDRECYVVASEFKDLLDVVDLSLFDFENVDVSGIDFRGCNPALLDPQKVYNKDLSDTRFDISEDEYDEKSGKVLYIPSSSWDLDGVNLNGSNLYVPSDYVKSNGLSMPINIDKAITSDKTILPDVWKDKLKNNINSSYDNLVIEEVLLKLIKNGESLNLVSKEEASMLKNYYIKENEENKGGKTL